MSPLVRIASVLVLVTVLGGMMAAMNRCTPDAAMAAKAGPLGAFASATITPDGLGDLVIGRTTLGEVVERYGPGGVEILAGDDLVAVQLVYAGGGLQLYFEVPPDHPDFQALLFAGPRALAASVRSGAPVTADATGRQLRNPRSLQTTPLASLSVAAPFFSGATEHGVRLGDSFLLARSTIARDAGDRSGRPAVPRMYAGLAGPEDKPDPFVIDGLLIRPDWDASTARAADLQQGVEHALGVEPIVAEIVVFGRRRG